jgi:hypothetical protein
MPTARDLEKAIVNLPLTERQTLLTTLERSISDEFDRMAAASVAADMRTIDLHLYEPPFTPEQTHELQARVEAADRGDANYVAWSEVRQRILTRLHRAE